MSELKIQNSTDCPIKLTDGAIAEIKRLIEVEQSNNAKALRIGVKGGGCAGFTYILEFDDKQEGDAEYTINGVKILLDFTHELYVTGMEVDYEQGLNNRGFIFNNPNAETTCGCGSSFG